MNRLIAEAVGWYGAVAMISAYALVSFNVTSANNIIYQILNLTGAIGIIVISLSKRVFQPVTVNIIWALIAFVALLKLIF